MVFNNQMYGTIRMHQERTYPWRVSGTALTNPDFAKYIEAFGGHGEVVSETGEFAPAFRRAVESGRPAIIELRVNPEQITTRQTIAQLRAGKAPPKPAAKPKRAAAAEASEAGAGASQARASREAERRAGMLYRLSAQFRTDATGNRLPRAAEPDIGRRRRGIIARATMRQRRASATQSSSASHSISTRCICAACCTWTQQQPERGARLSAPRGASAAGRAAAATSISATRCWRCSATTKR